jgi:hypothetical protein
MKELYSFSLLKEKQVEKTEETPEGKLTKMVTEKVPVKIILKKPSRLEIEQGEEVHAIEWSSCVKKGILTKAMLTRVYSDSGGLLSKDESDHYLELLNTFAEKDLEHKKLTLINDPDEDAKKKLKELQDAMSEIVVKVQHFENQQAQIFNQTADVRARNKAISWFVLNLSFTEEDGKVSPFFPGRTDDEKLEFYYNAEEEGDEFIRKAIEKISLTWSFWYMGKASSKEDFEFLEKQLEEAKAE